MLLLRQMFTLVDLMIKIQNYLVMILIMIWYVEMIEKHTKMTVLRVKSL
jgi:hypothetical protein